MGTRATPPAGLRFLVEVRSSRDSHALPMVFERQVAAGDRWFPWPIDLSPFAGQQVELTLRTEGNGPEVESYWGTAVVRSRLTDEGSEPQGPRGVILVLADTLRADHVGWSGYRRQTTPFLSALARQGAVFADCIAQGTWTKVSVPSILTSLYPTSHGVLEESARLSTSATTLAESFRDAGWTTLGLASIPLVGRASGLEQGFEEFHESASLPYAGTAKTARDLVDRLLPWLETHREDRFFVLLHVADPHGPYTPYPPFDALWGGPDRAEELAELDRRLAPHLRAPEQRPHHLPNREELRAAGIDPERYVGLEKDGYDGSIRGMDAELRRLDEALRHLDLDDDTLLVFVSDHGEEFLDHGHHFHGHSVYGELAQVPLLLRGPGVPPGRRIERTVQTIDLLPTILDLAGLAIPSQAQGRSLMPLLAGFAERDSWSPRPAIVEKPAVSSRHALEHSGYQSVALIHDGWKLIRNRPTPPDRPEYELFDHRSDPLDQVDLAARHPELVMRLAAVLARWQESAAASRLEQDGTDPAPLADPERRQLEALGYL